MPESIAVPVPLRSERVSPLHGIHVQAGASFTDFAGWQMPVRYSSDLAEHHAVRTAAGIFDLSHMAEILVIGREAGDALDYALAGKLSSIDVGQAKYSLLLGRDGGVIDDLVVYRTGEDRYLVVANASNREVVAAQLLDRTSPFDTEVFDESDDLALIAVQGPAALEILESLPQLVPDSIGPRELKYYRSAPGQFDGHNLLMARTGYTGEDGYELYLAPEAAPELWRALVEVGEPLGLVPAGLASRDTLRLEAGMPLYGHELGTGVQPAQAGLGRVVNLEKDGDFVGRAAIEAGAPDGARVLVGLVSEGKRAGRSGYGVYAGDAPVGEITSGALSPTLGHPIAMAFVDVASAVIGTELSIDVRGTRIPAVVSALPFYTRKAN